MTLPPLANLFAIHDPDPQALDEIMLELQRGGEFTQVWRPAPGWVAAAAPLPGGTPDDDLIRQHQFAFVEGRDLLVDNSGKDPDEALHQLAELADLQPERLVKLPGDFGFIRFRASGEATAVRSCGGLAPIYLKQAGKGWAIATRLGDLVRYLPDEPRIDPLVNAIWAAGWGLFPEKRTFLEEITLLGRGYFARLEREGRMQADQYWNPRQKLVPYPSTALMRDHAERLRSLLLEKLKRDLDPEGGNLLTLSGGVDSSSLAALAAGAAGRKVWIWSLLPAGEDKLQHEMAFIEPLAQQYGFERRWSVPYHEQLLFELWRNAPEVVFHIIHPALCNLPAVLREAQVSVLFGGEFADEVCGSVFTIPDWAEQTLPMKLLADWRAYARHPRKLARWGRERLDARRGRQSPPFPRDLLLCNRDDKKPLNVFRPEVQAEYLAWWQEQADRLNADHDPWRHLAMRMDVLDPFVPMNWEACSAVGIRRSFPFFNREVLELAFACHPAELYGPGTKKLLRNALRNDVPERNLQRADKGGWGRRDKGDPDRQGGLLPEGALPDELASVLRAGWFSQPLKELDYWQYRCLTRLLIFIDSLRKRRLMRQPTR